MRNRVVIIVKNLYNYAFKALLENSVRYMCAGKLFPNLPLILVDEWETPVIRNVMICGRLEFPSLFSCGYGHGSLLPIILSTLDCT